MTAAFLAAALAVAVPSPVPSPAPSPSPVTSAGPAAPATPQPSPSASPPVTPAPGESVVPQPSASPSATPSAFPSPTATPVYKYRVKPSPNPSAASDGPAILEVDLNDKQLTPHGKIAIRVLTSPDVVKVVTRSNGREGPLQQTAPGEFIGNGSIPGIPFIARGWKVNIEFVASTADGRTTSVKVPVTLG